MKKHVEDPCQAAYTALVNEFLPANKSMIKYIGEGDDKIAFATSDGHVSKFAKTRAGAMQIAREINTMNKYEWPCFLDLYDYDRNALGMEVECAARIDPDNENTAMKLLTGIGGFGHDLNDALKKCVAMCAALASVRLHIENADLSYFKDDPRHQVFTLAKCIQSPQTNAQGRIFNQLCQYFGYENIDGERFSTDLSLDDFGYVYRYGKLVLVPFDLGN